MMIVTNAARPEHGLVIFDCDGVLVDSEPICNELDRQMLAALGWHLTEQEIIERFVGRADEDCVRDIESHLGRSMTASWLCERHRRYRDAFADRLLPVDGVQYALDKIPAATCVASGSSPERLRFMLSLTGLWSRFEGRTFTAWDVEKGKPAPDLFLHAARTLGFVPEQCVVVEDSPAGVQAGLAAGMAVLAFRPGLSGDSPPKDPRVTLFGDMRDLPALVAHQR
jgi:HAD superfamily hydrolase (TIGR01509 family)